MPTQRDLENASLKEIIKEIFDNNKGRYGSIRFEKALNEHGIHANRKRISTLMCETTENLGLYEQLYWWQFQTILDIIVYYL